MSVFLVIMGVLAGVVGLLVPAIYGAGFIASGAVLFAAGFIISAIQSLNATMANGQNAFKMNTKTQRQCPECREIVRIDARRCKFCAAAMEPPPK
jgi:hypothetical protein